MDCQKCSGFWWLYWVQLWLLQSWFGMSAEFRLFNLLGILVEQVSGTYRVVGSDSYYTQQTSQIETSIVRLTPRRTQWFQFVPSSIQFGFFVSSLLCVDRSSLNLLHQQVPRSRSNRGVPSRYRCKVFGSCAIPWLFDMVGSILLHSFIKPCLLHLFDRDSFRSGRTTSNLLCSCPIHLSKLLLRLALHMQLRLRCSPGLHT